MWYPFGPFWSVKYLDFGKKLPIRITNHTFLERRYPEVTKIRGELKKEEFYNDRFPQLGKL